MHNIIQNIIQKGGGAMDKKKKVHVLYILTKLELGGAQKVCLSLIKGINRSQNLASLISGTEGVLVAEVKKFDSVYLLKSFKREIGIRTIFNEIKAFFQLMKKIKSLKKKHSGLIVHTHSTKAGILGRWAAFFARVKTRVHTVHGFAFHEHQNKLKWFTIYFFELMTSFITTHFVCVSEYDTKLGAKYLPRFAKKCSVIRAAVEWDRFYIPATKVEQKFHPAVKSSDDFRNKFVIGTVSCFKPQKNLFDLLKAFKLVCDNLGKKLSDNVLLQLVGDGVLRPEIENWITQHNMESKIELLGWQGDVSKWMRQWNLFAMSSLWEGLPCAVVEARLSHLPVVSYRIAGIPEVIFDNKNGFLIDAGNWKTLAQKIELLIKDEKLYQRMKNFKDELKDFQDKHMVEQHLQLYQKIL
jgi:glycosyltransferase involved in cell wall biosynthesis